MHTTLLDDSSSCDRWETFTSNGASSSSSSSIGAIGGFKGVVTSFAITKFSPSSTKTKGSQNNLAFIFEGGHYLYSRN